MNKYAHTHYVCNRRYRLGNAEKIKRYYAEWKAQNRERVNAINKKWRLANPDKFAASKARRRALLLHAAPPWLTEEHLEQIRQLYAEAQRLTKATGITYSVDHIWPLKGHGFVGLHVPWNLRVMPLSENKKKFMFRPS